MSFFSELKRRNVFRVGIAYVVVAWLVLQVADVVINNIEAPGWVFQVIMLVLALGFPLVLVFAWAFEMTPEGLKKENNVNRDQSVTRQTGHKLDRVIIGIMAVVIAFLVLDRFVLTDSPVENNQVADTAPVAIEAEQPGAETGPSVAVLPFVNMSEDANNEYFSDGLTETLLHMLAQLPELRVAARTSSFAFKGQNTSISDIADTLGVAHVLEGSVQKSGQRIRVTAQLIRATDGFHIWSQNYTRPLEDIFAIQDEIATDVAKALDISLLGGSKQIQNVETNNLAAYEAYLKALEQQANNSYASLPAAQNLFKEAIAADPQFVDAKIGLARNYNLMSWVGMIEEADSVELAIPLLRQVLANNPEHYQARAMLLYSELGLENKFEPQERRQKHQELRDLLPLFPGSSFLRYIVALNLSFNQAKYQEAIEVLQAGLLVDPLDPLLHATLGQTYRFQGHYDEAMTSLQRALTLQPKNANHYFDIADLKEELNDLNSAFEWRLKAAEVDPRDHELAAEIAQHLYQLGLLEEGHRWATRSISLAPTSAVGRKVALQQAYYQQDYERALMLAQNMIKDEVSVRHGSHFTALAIYTELMWKSGRQQDAFNFLVSRRPELANFTSFPGNYTGLQTQRFLIILMTAFESPDEVRLAWLAYAGNMDQGFPRWRVQTGSQVLDLVMQGRSDEAERLAIDVYLSEPIATNIRRIEYLREPVFDSINQRPEMLARLSEVEQERDKLRDGVSEMLLEPQWNQ